jgi:hypothetical protein
MNDLVVRQFEETDRPAWEGYVAGHPNGALYHTLGWRDFVTDIFGHEPVYLAAFRGGRVTGLLPLFVVRHPLLGSKALSLPYDVGSGGPLADDDATERALIEAAQAAAARAAVNYFEIRCDAARPTLDAMSFVRAEPVLISDMTLDGEEAVWARVRKDHVKAMRKAERRGITVTEARSLDEYMDFYDVYLRVFRDFGTPPYASAYFSALFDRMYSSGSVRLLLARLDGKAVGGLVFFCGGRTLVSKFAACVPDAVPLRAYAALYGEAIRLSLTLGYPKLSWGTSSRAQTGLVDFKEGWGATTRAAAVYQLAFRGTPPSLTRYYDSNGLAQRVWRTLPLGITRLVGPSLNRWFC